ncbi:MAG: WecB/TagA/CpsF family glycosyltransferase [Halothece sp.]
MKLSDNLALLDTLQKSEVMGLPIHLSDDYISWLRSRLQQKQGTHIVTLNSEMAMMARDDQFLADIIREADLVIPDGSGVILYLRLRQQKQQRCPGIELAQSLLQMASTQENACPVIFYGAKPGVAAQAASIWQQRVPSLSITAVHGYLSSEEQAIFKQTLEEQQPSIIFVGLGVPRQELWIRQHRHLCPNAIWVGVGGSFDIWAGVKSRAPLWLRNNHLEWLYRLYQEPWRWQRMLVLPQFAFRALIER